MQYLISFLEGVITFISPCLLPMLPVYISYFAGGGERTTRKTMGGAAGFVLGFTLVFVAMGALAGTLGSFLTKYQTAVNIVSGLVVVLDYIPVAKAPMILIVNASDKSAKDEIMTAVKQNVKAYTIKSQVVESDHLDMVIEVRTADMDSLVDGVSNIEKVSRCSLLSHDGEVTF